MTTIASIALCLLLKILVTDAARILAIYPLPLISHQLVFRSITLELVKRGHEVVVLTTDPMFPKGGKEEPPTNLTEIDVHDISYAAWRVYTESSRGNKNDLLEQITVGLATLLNLLNKQFRVEEVRKLINGKQGKFDILLVELCARQVLAFSHVYQIPVIQISSLGPIYGFNEITGASWHPLLYPFPLNQRLYNLTMYEKINELKNSYQISKVFLSDMVETENNILKKHFGPNIPEIKELQNNIDMVFLNVHPIWEGNRPVPPSVIHLGGLPQKSNKELPKDLKTYLDSSQHGVIYISFGTNVQPSLLPPEKIQILVRTFSKLPHNVLWKWDKDVLPGKSDNIRLFKWLPQSDLLKHPKVKVFITQGGLQSTDEAIIAGVPLLGIPMLGDQWYNTEKYVHHGIGLKLEMESLTEELFTNAINTIIQDESYRNNIIKLRGIMFDQPQTSLERAIWWIEYVLRHGGAKHLRSPAANISWSQYLELELVAVVLSALFSLFLVIIGFFYSFYRLCNILFIKAKVKSN